MKLYMAEGLRKSSRKMLKKREKTYIMINCKSFFFFQGVPQKEIRGGFLRQAEGEQAGTGAICAGRNGREDGQGGRGGPVQAALCGRGRGFCGAYLRQGAGEKARLPDLYEAVF